MDDIYKFALRRLQKNQDITKCPKVLNGTNE